MATIHPYYLPTGYPLQATLVAYLWLEHIDAGYWPRLLVGLYLILWWVSAFTTRQNAIYGKPICEPIED